MHKGIKQFHYNERPPCSHFNLVVQLWSINMHLFKEQNLKVYYNLDQIIIKT